MSYRNRIHKWQQFALFLLPALLTAAAFAGQAPNAPADTTPEQRDAMKRFLAVKKWHIQVRVQISGGGHKSSAGEGHEKSFSVHRLAEYKVELPVNSGELTGLTAVEQMIKKFPNNPQLMKRYEQLSTQRHWQPDQMTIVKADNNAEVNFVVADSDGSSFEDWGEGGRMGPDIVRQNSLAGGKSGAQYMYATLSIDLKKGTYGIQLPPDKLDAVETRSSSIASENKTTKVQMSATSWDRRIKDQPLPATGNILSGHIAIPAKDLDGMRRGADFGKIAGVIEWTASPQPLPDVLLLLTPEKYDDWLPRGGKTEADPGDTIKVKARLKARNGSLGDTKITEIRFKLDDVSREPGVCLNLPLKKGAETPDLKFVPAANAGYIIDDEGSLARRKGEFTDASVVVTAFDWGAWGELTAVAELNDGRLLFGKVEDSPLEEVLRLPKRDPDSHIGDKWKKDMNAPYIADTDDAERTKGNKHDGDGLTAYEEYRGLIAQQKHTRDHSAGRDGRKPLSPQFKDLIVHNTIKGRYAGAARAGLDLFAKASNIHVVELDDGELPESRQINVNRKSFSAGEQFGLRLVNEAGKEKGTIGLSTSVGFKPGEEAVAPSPKYWTKIAADLAQIDRRYRLQAAVAAKAGVKMPYTAENDIAVTIAHELGHGVGALHHGREPGSDLTTEITDKMKQWKAFESDGSEITSRPFTPEGGVGLPQGESGGDVNCIMCYNNAYNWAAHSVGAYGPPYIYYKGSLLPNGRIFCTSPKGTGLNAPHTVNGKTLPGLFGDAGIDRGNCLAKLKVKDQ